MKIHQKFLKKHCSNIPPVDIEAIVASLGIQLVFFPFKKIDGMCLQESGNWTIVVNTNISPSKKRFTMAHELKHVLSGEASFLFPDSTHSKSKKQMPLRVVFWFQHSHLWRHGNKTRILGIWLDCLECRSR